MEGTVSTLHTSFQLQEGVYKLDAAYSSQTAKHSATQRATKASFLRVTAPRPPSSSPSVKSKARLSFAKKNTPPPPPSGAAGSGAAGGEGEGGGPGVDYLAMPAGDTLCVCNLGNLGSESSQREKRLASDPTCCSINPRTSSLENLDLLVGLESGEVLLLEGLSLAPKARFNAGGALNSARVLDVKWVPSSPSQFVATFANGVLLVLDKDKDDGSNKAAASADSSDRGDAGVSITRPKGSKNNPVSRWLCGRGPAHHAAFSPDAKMMAVCCHDGHARVFDFAAERLQVSFRSQYGAMLCSSWSPDSLYLVTGGEDDTVMVWNVRDRVPVARCPAHNSWVSCVAFDPAMCEADADPVPGVAPACSYRFISVGQDGRVCLWDLNEGSIVVSRKRPPTGPRPSLAGPPSGRPGVVESPRDDCPHMEAALNILIDQEPLSNLVVTPSGLVTTSFTGHTKLWSRPLASPGADSDRSSVGVA